MNNKPFEWLGSLTCAALTVVQTQQVFQIISLVLTILTTLVTLFFTIYKWYNKAKSDGKIDAEEIAELTEIVSDNIDKINNIVSSDEEEKE